MVRKRLPALLLLLALAGCGGCVDGEAAKRSAPPAKRWRADPPAENAAERLEAPPEDAADKPQVEPAGDRSEPAPADDPPTEPKAPAGAAPPEHAEPPKQAEPQSDGPAPPADPAADPKTGVTTLRTDDCDEWPSCEVPMEIHIKTPEVPERLTELAPPIEDD